MPAKRHLDWFEVRELVEEMRLEIYERYPATVGVGVYGVPRGGIFVACLLAGGAGVLYPVDEIGDADIVVDDLIDSGRTQERYASTGKPFYALIDKRKPEWAGAWIVFPWEREDESKDIRDHATRLLEYLNLPTTPQAVDALLRGDFEVGCINPALQN